MKNDSYWKKRFEDLEASEHKGSTISIQSLESHYTKAQRDIEGKIESWYQRFATNNQISMVEARKFLSSKELKEFKWDVKEYIKYGQENEVNQLWMKELENASARYHISRLEALKVQTQQSLEVLYGNQLDELDAHMKHAYSEGYYHTLYELQKGFNIGWDIASIDQRKLKNIISKPWVADGRNFSSRVWDNKNKLVNELHNELTQMTILGRSPDEAIRNISRKMNTSKTNAGRLVMTESAYFSSQSQKDAFNDLDVEQYEIVATLDSRTSAICQELDGKVFNMKDFDAGVTAPPFHVWCRTTTVPFFDDEFNIGERAARDEETGQTYYVPSNITYPQWKEKFVDKISKDGLKPMSPGDIVKVVKEKIKNLDKLKSSGMNEDDYGEYLGIINDHDNSSVRNVYLKYGDEVDNVKLTKKGVYSPSGNRIEFSYPQYDDMNKYGTLAHEYGHFFDDKVPFEGLKFKEMEKVREATGLDFAFRNVASSSDEFLEVIRKDKEHLRSAITSEVKADLIANNASSGVQDAIDGLLGQRIKWGHGNRYYNRKYADIQFMDKLGRTSKKNDLKQAYLDLGFDASNQSKVKNIVRNYEAASEAWANIISAEVCGGDSLKYVKTYLPNSYKKVIEILEGVK